MKDYIENRAIMLAYYILEHNATVRSAAKQFGFSKSGVHKDVTTRLEDIDPLLAADVKVVLEKNKAERHIRGGIATKKMYEQRKYTHTH